MKSKVPEAPTPIVIEEGDLQRLAGWVKFFKELSHRIKVLERNSAEVSKFLISAEAVTRRVNRIEDDCTLIGWPTLDQVAFVITINSAPLDDKPVYMPKDAYFFCLDGTAFGITYFEWDGDGEEMRWDKTYSLRDYSPSSICWNYIQQIIVGKIKEMARRVPELK